jgi:hypothetical protein
MAQGKSKRPTNNQNVAQRRDSTHGERENASQQGNGSPEKYGLWGVNYQPAKWGSVFSFWQSLVTMQLMLFVNLPPWPKRPFENESDGRNTES